MAYCRKKLGDNTCPDYSEMKMTAMVTKSITFQVQGFFLPWQQFSIQQQDYNYLDLTTSAQLWVTSSKKQSECHCWQVNSIDRRIKVKPLSLWVET